MAERMTSIRLPGLRGGTGIADWGRKTPKEMIEMIRCKAEEDLKNSQAILAAEDSDFNIETYVGVHVQRSREVIQQGKPG